MQQPKNPGFFCPPSINVVTVVSDIKTVKEIKMGHLERNVGEGGAA